MFRCHRVRKNTEGLHCLDFLKFFRPSRPTVIVLLLCCNILSREYQRFFSPPMTLQPNAGHGLPIHEVSTSHTTTHHSRYDFSGRVISSSQRPLPDNTQNSQQTNIHPPGGIRTHNLSRRAIADLRLRPRGHWDRQYQRFNKVKTNKHTVSWEYQNFNDVETNKCTPYPILCGW